MKRLFIMLLLLFFLYFGIQYIYYFLGKGHQVEYQIKVDEKTYFVSEMNTKNMKGERNNYYFEIKEGNNLYSFQVFKSFVKGKKVIENIIAINENDYRCILPIFDKSESLLDILCTKNNILYYYNSIKGKYTNLDEAVSKLSLDIYNPNKHNYDNQRYENLENVSVNKDNLINKHYILINDYKGVIHLYNDYTKGAKYINLFNNDVYNPKLSINFDKYYVIADYNEQYEFSSFNIINIIDGNVKKLDFNYKISYDSYIQGTVDGNIYLFDRDNKTQYEIDPAKVTINQTETPNTDIRVYQKGEWIKVSAESASKNDYLFTNEEELLSKDGYDKVVKVGNNLSGYIYLFKKNGNNYDVYRSNVQNENIVTYLFTTDNLDKVKYLDEYIYYSFNNYIYVYSDNVGSNKIFTHQEFQFNKNLDYYIVKK